MSVIAEESFVVFEISKTQFGLSIEDIDKIYQVEKAKIFHIPKSSPEILGLYRDKGNIVPVIDLSLLLKKHKIISKISNKGKGTKYFLPSFRMKVKGITMIFILPSKPDVIGIDIETRLEKKTNEIIKSRGLYQVTGTAIFPVN